MWHALLPILTLVLVSIGPSIYVVRTLTLNVAQDDHVTLARAKGMSEGVVQRRHILRVAAPPIVTGLILGLAGSIGGAILVETVFGWQGMGRLYYESIAGTPDDGLIVAPHVHVHARLRHRPDGARGAVRVPRPAGPVRVVTGSVRVRRRGVLRQLLASGPGRVGLVLAAILVLGSVYVVLTYPFDYGPTRWSNPTVWADNPHAAPPAWTNLFGPQQGGPPGADRRRHRAPSPPPGRRRSGRTRCRSRFAEDEPPSFLSFDLGQVTYHGAAALA